MIRLGIFTDAHYAEGLTACNTRACWQSMEKVERIFGALNGAVDAYVQLGDLIQASGDHGKDMKNIHAMQKLLAGCGKSVYGVLGNHDVEAAEKRVYLPEREQGYYAFERSGVTFIVLDGNFTSEGISYEQADWDWTDALIPGGQLKWLESTLAEAKGRAVILCHQNLDERPGDPHVIKNAREVRRVIEESGKVMAVLQGHCHRGCFQTINGIPYYTFRALCEGEQIPCAVVTVREGEILVEERELTEA